MMMASSSSYRNVLPPHTSWHGCNDPLQQPAAAAIAVRQGPQFDSPCVRQVFPTPAPPDVSIQSIVVTLDTNNRIREGCHGACDEFGQPLVDDPANPTNNVTLPISISEGPLKVVQAYIAMVQVPLAQYTVEECQKRLWFSEGIRLDVLETADDTVRALSVEVDGVVSTAQLPPFLNAVVDVDATDPTHPIFTTQFNHALDVVDAWNWGQPIHLVSTPIDGDASLILSSSNVTILTPTSFQVSGVTSTTWTASGSGVFAYVNAPTIPSPAHLARLVTAALDVVAPGEFAVSYNPCTGMFTVVWNGPQVGCQTDQRQSGCDVYLFNEYSNSLAGIMGFAGSSRLPFRRKTVEKSAGAYVRTTTCPQYEVVGTFGFQCRSFIDVQPGSYLPQALLTELGSVFNRMYFDGGCAKDPALRSVFVFSDACGTCHSIPIPYGMYSPEQLAAYIQQEMNAADPLGNTYQVQYSQDDGVFLFESTATFGLEFGEAANTMSPTRIGFLPVAYRGDTMYQSQRPFFAPQTRCCGTLLPTGRPSYLYQPVWMSAQQKMSLNVCKPPIVSGTLVNLGDGVGQITTGVAHGFNAGEAVDVTLAGNTFTVLVKHVVSAFVFNVELGGTALDAGGSVCAVKSGIVVSNLLFSKLANQPHMPGYLLGFSERDVLWKDDALAPAASSSSLQPCAAQCVSPSQAVTGSPPFVSVYNMELNTPQYALLHFTYPPGEAHCQQQWGDENMTNVLPIPLFTTNTQQFTRVFPLTMHWPQGVRLTQVKMALLNPDHTPMQLHNKNWSVIIVLQTPVASIQMGLC